MKWTGAGETGSVLICSQRLDGFKSERQQLEINSSPWTNGLEATRRTWYPDRIPQDKFPQDKIPTDTILQDKIPLTI